MAKISVLNITGEAIEDIEISDDILNNNINQSVLHQAIVMYQACLRQGNASTKERGQVSGGGKKPYKQKGTGRARAGSSRSPLWSGGGVTFGPHPRDFRYTIPKKIKKKALQESLKAKYVQENLICCQDITDKLEKTKDFVSILKNLKIEKTKTLALLDGSFENIGLITRNIQFINLMRACDANAYDILKFKNLLITKSALDTLINRIKVS